MEFVDEAGSCELWIRALVVGGRYQALVVPRLTLYHFERLALLQGLFKEWRPQECKGVLSRCLPDYLYIMIKFIEREFAYLFADLLRGLALVVHPEYGPFAEARLNLS